MNRPMQGGHICLGLLAALVVVLPSPEGQAARPAPVVRTERLREVPIPIIHVKGSHYEAGKQLGAQQKAVLTRAVERAKARPDWPKVRRGTRLGKVTVDRLKEILADHVNYPESICRHGASVKSTFSIILNLNTLTMLLAKGNPCEVKYNEYRLIEPARRLTT